MRVITRITISLLSYAICVRAENLLDELKRRNATEGSALIKWNGSPVGIVTFDGVYHNESGGPYLSVAWFNPAGDVVVWNHHIHADEPRGVSCRNPLIVVSKKAAPWQLPGNFINVYSLGVSADGRRLALDQPTGLSVADSTANTITRISDSCGTTSISWSEDSNAFTYDCHDRILIYDVLTKKSRQIATGSTPSWSPDGQWIAFRSGGRAMAVDPVTMRRKTLMDGRTIEWGIHWSPDSRYIMAAKRVGLFEAMLHGDFGNLLSDDYFKILIYRLQDDAGMDQLRFPMDGEDDRGYFWVNDYQSVLRSAAEPPVIKPCP